MYKDTKYILDYYQIPNKVLVSTSNYTRYYILSICDTNIGPIWKCESVGLLGMDRPWAANNKAICKDKGLETNFLNNLIISFEDCEKTFNA